jgi:hypothetical protein
MDERREDCGISRLAHAFEVWLVHLLCCVSKGWSQILSTQIAKREQQACICVNFTYYTLNNKLEKAIFRNVRLTLDFKNFERLVDGTRKLVIPQLLFQRSCGRRTGCAQPRSACSL